MHSVPKAGQSCGFFTPLNTRPLMQTVDSSVSISSTANNCSASWLRNAARSSVSAVGNRSNAAPFAVTDLEDRIHQVLSDTISFTLYDARILVLHLGDAGFELAHRQENTLEDV